MAEEEAVHDVASALESRLRALASGPRRAILAQLRTPSALADLRVAAASGSTKSISKQAVQAHLRHLVAAGLVRRDETAGGDTRVQYIMDISAMYGLASDVLDLCSSYGGETAADTLTRVAGRPPPKGTKIGPHLLLVQGAYPGKVFRLRSTTASPDGWRIGRSKEAEIGLDYDPYVSRDHAMVGKGARSHTIEASRTAANGTWVNWQELVPGETVKLVPGDVINVGKSTLAYRAS